jgi:CRISPR-associated protein Csb2
MLTIWLRFPYGRFYAHPWGQNPVRVAEAEWPPSPWRLLRAIAAAWFRRNPGLPASCEFSTLMETLGQELPVMKLPPVSFSKTVHYHPNPGVPSGKVRHENHFVAVGGDVLFQWTLAKIASKNRGAEAVRIKTTLEDLVVDISYFGRAESVCEISVFVGDQILDPSSCAAVVINDQKPGRRIATDCRDVFCPNPDEFVAADLWQLRSKVNDSSIVPKHLVQDLLDTPQPLPDGAAWYSYKMPAGWPERWVIRHPKPVKRTRVDESIVAHYLEFSLQCRIPVPSKHVVSLASSFRAAAIKNFKRGDSDRQSFALSGHDRPKDVIGEHLHAFYLPVPNELTANLESLRVWCRHGITQREINAMMSVGSLYWADGRFPVRPVLLKVTRELPIPSASKQWHSLTPFVPPRHWYRKKISEGRVRDGDSPEIQLSKCLRENGITADVAITRAQEDIAWDTCKVHVPKSKDVRQSNTRIGIQLNIEFESAVSLPFPSFGHSCHFGLGVFAPTSCRDSDQSFARNST